MGCDERNNQNEYGFVNGITTMENEVYELNYDEIMALIQGQLLEYMNSEGNYERFKDYKIFLSREQQFMKVKDKDPNAIYIVVKFGSADVVFGQTVLPATITALSEQDRIETVTALLYEYAQKYNLQRVNDDTINQVYESPSVTTNFAPIYEGFRSVVAMSAAFVIGKNANDYKVYYYYTDDGKTYFADEVPQMSASFAFVANPDTQAFYNSNDFTRSVNGFGGVTLGFTTLILSDNRLINDVLDILGTVPEAGETKQVPKRDANGSVIKDANGNIVTEPVSLFSYVLNDDTKKYITDSDIKTDADVAAYITAEDIKAPYDNVSVICSKTDMVWRYDGKKWKTNGTKLNKVPNDTEYRADSTVNKRFRLGVVFRDGTHARVKDYRLTNSTSSQEIGQIPAISLAFVE